MITLYMACLKPTSFIDKRRKLDRAAEIFINNFICERLIFDMIYNKEIFVMIFSLYISGKCYVSIYFLLLTRCNYSSEIFDEYGYN